MKGLELSEKFYNAFGAPMLQADFPDLLPFIAVGLTGSGSECYGFDDEISRDHDFEPGFCIFIPDEDIIDNQSAFRLERAYSALPREFMGFERPLQTPVGGNRHGVIRTNDFFKNKVGSPNGKLSEGDWFTIPESALAEAVNGKIFFDNYGEVSLIRSRLSYYPEDIRIKKLAGNLLIMGQAGQYNYGRSIKRNDTAAAQLAVIEFVKSAINVIFLLNKSYAPYYKWSFRALKELPLLNELSDDLEYLISSGNDSNEASNKILTVDSIGETVIRELKNQSLTKYNGSELEGHAYSVNNAVKDGDIRNLHILSGI